MRGRWTIVAGTVICSTRRFVLVSITMARDFVWRMRRFLGRCLRLERWLLCDNLDDPVDLVSQDLGEGLTTDGMVIICRFV